MYFIAKVMDLINEAHKQAELACCYREASLPAALMGSDRSMENAQKDAEISALSYVKQAYEWVPYISYAQGFTIPQLLLAHGMLTNVAMALNEPLNGTYMSAPTLHLLSEICYLTQMSPEEALSLCFVLSNPHVRAMLLEQVDPKSITPTIMALAGKGDVAFYKALEAKIEN